MTALTHDTRPRSLFTRLFERAVVAREPLTGKDPDQSGREMKEAAQFAIAKALLHIKQEEREPDRWEELHLRCALDAVALGQYLSASVHAQMVICPSPSQMAKNHGVGRCTVDELIHDLCAIARS
ncbi:hypothetical protein [Methylibium sp.]|uniref:hypothetical protein n=1 Tax=Methylibium sp. TaxID=2067992 RepID=UPI003D0CFA45